MASLHPRSTPRKEDVCSVCMEKCTHSRIFCDMCSTWLHTACDMMSAETVRSFEQLPADLHYICRKCRCDAEGNLDYEKAMTRLHKAAIQGYKKLASYIKREQLFLDGPFVGVSGIGNLAVDLYSQTLLDKHVPNQGGIPACATAEGGQALFCAVSLAVSARESLATELRYRCCLEMVMYESFYRWHKSYAQLSTCAPEYADSCLDCAIPGEAPSVWMMAALASVVNRPVISVYPRLGNPSNPAHKVLNTTFYPRGEGTSSQPVKIMWTNVDLANANQKWVPNHFVPLFEQQQQPDSNPSSPACPFKSDDDLDIEGDADTSQDPALKEAVETAVKEALAAAEGGFPMDIPRYMDVYEAYDHITTATTVLDKIPPGRKDNCWFMFDNSYNVNNPARKNCFYDDCGVWDSKLGSVVKAYYILDEKDQLHSLKVDGGVYKMLTTNKSGKRQWVKMDPQPDPDRVVICHRYYAFLKRDTNYKRRILWFTFPPGVQKGRDIAIAEYCGVYPGHGDSHGNSKGRRAYRRTDPKLLDQITEHLKAQNNEVTPNKLFKDLVQSMGAENTLRDPRQIRNLKYKINKKAGKVKPRSKAKDKPAATELTASETTAPDDRPPIKVVIRGMQNPDDEGQVILDAEQAQKLMQVSGQTIQIVSPEGAEDLPRDMDTQTIIIEGLSVVAPTYVDQAVG